jgi:hypothetical protein
MGISVGRQVLSRVVDSLFGDLKHRYIYNFMDDLIVYSRTVSTCIVPFPSLVQGSAPQKQHLYTAPLGSFHLNFLPGQSR